MEVMKISSQYYVVRHESDGKMTVVDGPYPEAWQAASATRMTEL